MRASVSATRTGDDPVAVLDAARTTLEELPGVLIAAVDPIARAAILEGVVLARGTLSMSGLHATLDVGSNITSGETSAQTELYATPAGPWAIAESGAAAHDIANARGMPTPYGVFRRVHHPGSPGRHMWDGATANAEQAAIDEANRVADAVDLGS